MHRVRNAVIIIILCIIGAATLKRKAPQLALNPPASETLQDAVANSPVHRGQPLTLASNQIEDLRDALAANAVETPNSQNGNTLDDVPPPPHGSGNGGFGPQSGPNLNQDLIPPPSVSPSGPENPPSQEE